MDLLQPVGGPRDKVEVLSFPGDSWMWERSIDEAFDTLNFRFTGLERAPGIHRNTVRQADLLPARFQTTKSPMDFNCFAQGRDKRHKQFDLIYLDWMGTWSREKKVNIRNLFEADMLAVGGLLLLTLSLRRGRPETMEELKDLSYDLPLMFYDARGEDKYTRSLKVRGIPHWVEAEAHDSYRVNMRPLMANIYYSKTGVRDGQTQPQLQLLFLREG